MQIASVQNKFGAWIIMLLLLVSLHRSTAAGVSLAWDPSPDSSVVGYDIYFGTTSGSYSNKISVENLTSATVSNLDCGDTYYFAATAVDSNGNESDFSNEIQFILLGILTLSQGLQPGDPALIKFPVEPAPWYDVQAATDLNRI